MEQRDRQYFKDVFEICKQIAFHEIYMESCRRDLANDDNYDPMTGFKSMDHFKHNRVVAYQLSSFFQMHRIQATVQQCQQVIQSLDKSLGQMDYESFEEITMTADITLKNLSQTRFSHVEIGVGSYARLLYVKEHSQHVVALFLEKQLNFYRHCLFLRQEFCRKWGGDVYTILQKMFKKYQTTSKQEGINFQTFYEVGRVYGQIFNKVEFFAIWRRSKKRRATIDEISGDIVLTFQQLHELLLVKNLNTKVKYALERNVPLLKALERPTPSYQKCHWRDYEKWQAEKKKKEVEEMEEIRNRKMTNIKYNFSSWQSIQDPLYIQGYFRQKAQSWNAEVDNMSQETLSHKYKELTSGSSLIRK